MNKFASLPMLFMLFASLGFAWTSGYEPTTGTTIYSVVDVNFTLTSGAYSTNTSNRILMGNITADSSFIYEVLNTTHLKASTGEASTATIKGLPFPISGNYSGGNFCSYTTSRYIQCTNETGNPKIYFPTGTGGLSLNLTEVNSTHYKINSTTCIKANGWDIVFNSGGGAETHCTGGKDYAVIPIFNTNNWTEISTSTPSFSLTTGSDYISLSSISTKTLRSDFKTGANVLNNTSSYCQNLLYFNNPYYGNIQLIPKITYIPGVDAFADFINTSSNAAYIPNNTITYIFDSVTSIWYIVPATICSSHSIVGSTTTLQYNPTATGTAVGGTVPIDVTGITGSCSYAPGTRIITCTGTDTSNTVTSLNLSAYLTGNTTDLCGSGVAGASGTLTCTLPAQNGTYNVIFYGSDADLFLHSFASKTIVIGSGTTGYGRDAYIAVFLLVGVAALLLSSNIAVSMVLMCFGLFVGLAVGVLPISDAPVVVFFTVIALVLAYRLKV